MKPAVSNALVGVVFLGMLGFIGYLILSHGTALEEVSRPPEPFRGTFLADERSSPRTAVRFLGNGQAQTLINGEVYGPMCSYTIEGDLITMKHSCGISYYRIQDGSLSKGPYDLRYERVNN